MTELKYLDEKRCAFNFYEEDNLKKQIIWNQAMNGKFYWMFWSVDRSDFTFQFSSHDPGYMELNQIYSDIMQDNIISIDDCLFSDLEYYSAEEQIVLLEATKRKWRELNACNELYKQALIMDNMITWYSDDKSLATANSVSICKKQNIIEVSFQNRDKLYSNSVCFSKNKSRYNDCYLPFLRAYDVQMQKRGVAKRFLKQ